MNNLNLLVIAVIAIITIGLVDQQVNGATIEDIKSELPYSKISFMGLDATVDTINLNVNNEFYAEYQNSYNNSFIFVELKPIMGIQTVDMSQTIATNQPHLVQKPVNYIPVNSEIEELKNEIEELKNEDRNNDDKDDNNDSNNNDDNNNKDDKDDNSNDITKSDPRFDDKYDSIDWMDGEDESKNMSIEDMDKHLEEQENENQEDNDKEQD